RVSNFVVVGDKAYTWNPIGLWSLDLFRFVWDIVGVDGDLPQLRENGALLRTVDTERDVIELSMLYRPHMMYVVRYYLGGDPPQPTVIDDHRVTWRELNLLLKETRDRLVLEEAVKKQEKEHQIQKLRDEDGKNATRPLVYSRRCGVCFTENPVQRAFFTSCGHFSCLACAIQLSNDVGRFDCPFCRNK
ncbi:hypothetical protein PFISCL1PPCAC_9015, partial [Pristionchus fissidentatus]